MCLPPAPEGSAAFPASRAPTDKPPFSVGTLRRAIPAHCFERSALRSLGYLIVDLLAVAALYWASTFIDRAPAVLAWGLLWPLYWCGARALAPCTEALPRSGAVASRPAPPAASRPPAARGSS